MVDKSRLRECKYHRIAHLGNSDFSTETEELDGFVDIYDYEKLYDKNLVPVPFSEFVINHECREAAEKAKFHRNKETIAELYEIILEKQGKEGLKRARELFRREIGCYSIDEKRIYLALPYQEDEIRILSKIVKDLKD